MTQSEASVFYPVFLFFGQWYRRFFIPSKQLTRVTVNDIKDLLVQGGNSLNLKMVMSLFKWKLLCLSTCFYDAHVQYDKN